MGAQRRRRPRRAARRADPRQGRVPAAPHLPLLQPGVRAARRRRSHRVTGDDVADAARQAAARPAGHAGAPRTTRSSRSPAATSCTRGTARCARSRAPTPARWRRPGSSGRRWPTWPSGRRSWPSRGPAVLAAEHASPRCARRSSSATWSRGPPGTGSALELYRVGERVYVGHGGSMPGYLAILAVHRPSRTGVVGVRQRVQPARRLDRRAGPRRADRRARPRAGAARAVAAGRARPPPHVAPLCGRWWWMGVEYDLAWDADAGELVFAHGARPARRRPGGSRRRAPTGGAAAPARTTARCCRCAATNTDAVAALDIATFVFTRDPDSGPALVARLGHEVDQALHRVDQRRLHVLVAADRATGSAATCRPARRRRGPRRRPPSTAGPAGPPATPGCRPRPA